MAQQLPDGKVYPLNSRRLTVKHLQLLAEVLGLPTQASGDELRQMIEGTLTDKGREPENVQVVIHERRRVTSELTVYLTDETGVFERTQRNTDASESSMTGNTAELDELRAERDHLHNTVTILTERLTQLSTQMEEEKERNKRAWKENCLRLQALDAELADKDAELASRDAHIARLNQPSDSLDRVRVQFAARDSTPYLYPHARTQLQYSPSPSPSDLSVISLRELPQQVQRDSSIRQQAPTDPTSRRAAPASVLTVQAALETVQQDGRRHRRGRAPPVEQYTGENRDEQLDDWLPTLERAGQWNEWMPEELLLQLAGHLRGRALQEWNLLSQSEKSSWGSAIQALKSRLEPGVRALAAQDFRHLAQSDGEAVSDFLCRLERTFQLAYGRDHMSEETRSTLMYYQLQEGLSYSLMKSPAVSGARNYTELSLAAKNEEKRQAELIRCQQYHQANIPRVGSKKLGTYTRAPQQIKLEPPSVQRSTVPSRGGQSSSANETRRCYKCDGVGHLARDCKVKKSESSGQQQHRTRTNQVLTQEKEKGENVQPSPVSFLLSSSDSEEGTVKVVRVKDAGSAPRCVRVNIQGVPIFGLIDSGADITILGSTMFKKVATTARLRKRNFKSVDKVACSYDQRPFRLDGRMDLEITFNGKSIITPVYIKMDAPEQLLLSEGVCRQLNILTYHPDVQVWRGGRKRVSALPPRAQVPTVRIRLLQSTRVPPSYSVVVAVQADQDFNKKQTVMLLEPIPDMESKMDATLVNMTKGVAYVRISNTDTSTLKLDKGTQISTATPVVTIDGNTNSVESSDKSADLFRVSSSSDERRTERCKKLLDLLQLDKSHLSAPERKTLDECLCSYHEAFVLDPNERGDTDLVQFTIDTGGEHPRRQPARRMPLAVREEVARQLKVMQQNGVIRPSNSSWASPVVLVRKKNGTHRFCVDYRALNSITKADTFPLPRIDDLLDQLGESKYFSTLDLAAGYWQIRVHPDSQAKTAFITPQGLFEFQVMPFGLTNAPAVFQRLMQNVITGLNPEEGPDFVSAYIDDILIFSRSLSDHIVHLNKVLERLVESGLKLQPLKCHFIRQEIS